MLRFFSWIFTMIFAFSLGAGVGNNNDGASDSALRQKVRDHMDVIADESAAMVDDVVDEFRQNEHVQKAEEFVSDVDEILDNTVEDIKDHFGGDKDETEEAVEEAEEAVEEAEEAVEEAANEAAEDPEEAAEDAGEAAEDAAGQVPGEGEAAE